MKGYGCKVGNQDQGHIDEGWKYVGVWMEMGSEHEWMKGT
jgi:hypothetical protein